MHWGVSVRLLRNRASRMPTGNESGCDIIEDNLMIKKSTSLLYGIGAHPNVTHPVNSNGWRDFSAVLISVLRNRK